MNWYSVFYWLTVADGVKRFFDVISDWFTFFTIIFFIISVIVIVLKGVAISENKDSSTEEEKVDPDVRGFELVKRYSIRFCYISLAISLIAWLGYVITPTKKDCLLIIAGGSVGNFMTSDSSAKQLPGDVTKFLHMSLQKEIASLNDNDRKEIGMQSPKEQLMEKVKNLSKDELLKYLSTDTTLVK